MRSKGKSAARWRRGTRRVCLSRPQTFPRSNFPESSLCTGFSGDFSGDLNGDADVRLSLVFVFNPPGPLPNTTE